LSQVLYHAGDVEKAFQTVRLADVLTGSRIVVAPIIVWLIFSDKPDAAYYLFATAAITDLLDGYAARRSKKTTTYGATFDGLADFVLVYTTIVSLAIKVHTYWLLAAGLLSIAFLIPVVGLISRKKGGLTIPHLDTNLLAAFVYPTVMVHIIDWRYASYVLLAGFLILLYYGIKYSRYLLTIYKEAKSNIS
jgi:phosphatidylglycerophosphate synthase